MSRPQATASDSPATPAPRSASTATRRHPINPVSQIAQTAGEPALAPAAAPIEVAEATPATAPAAPNAAPTRVAQATTPAAPSGAAPNAAAQQKPEPAASSIPPCDKPGGTGLARIVEIDTTGGPGFGFEHFKQYDFLRDKEVVLTFDDGPWPGNTPAVLKALTDECLRATFFEIGEHASWHPEITKQVIAAGMIIGTHTWSHKDLARNPYAKDIEQAKAEIEMGISAVHMAAGGVGIAVLQLCATIPGVETFGTASAGKHGILREEGCTHPIDYRSTDYAERVRELTDGAGVDVVLDPLGGKDWATGMSLLRPVGHFVAYGFANIASGERRNRRCVPVAARGAHRELEERGVPLRAVEELRIEDAARVSDRRLDEDGLARRPRLRLAAAARHHDVRLLL